MAEHCPDGRCRASELEGRVAERDREIARQRARLRELSERLSEARWVAVTEKADEDGPCGVCGAPVGKPHRVTCVVGGRHPVDYSRDTAHHRFLGDGDVCAGCGEHRNWHPNAPRLVTDRRGR